MKTYTGRRIPGKCIVTVAPTNQMIKLRAELLPDEPFMKGFEWGHESTGSAQLALSLLADYFGKDALAVDLHRPFMRDVVSRFPKEGWTLTSLEIEAWLAKRRGEAPKLRCPNCGAPDAVQVESYSMLHVQKPLTLTFNENGCAVGFTFPTMTDDGVEPAGDFADVLCTCTRCKDHLTLDFILKTHQ